MLERLRLIDFKSFADATAEFGPLTLVVGANASGKSNLLDAIQVLKHTPWMDFKQIFEGDRASGRGEGSWGGLRGGLREAARGGLRDGARAQFTLESRWGALAFYGNDDPIDAEHVTLEHRLVLHTKSARLVEESLHVDGSPVWQTSAQGDQLRVEIPGDTADGRIELLRVNPEASLLCTRLQAPAADKLTFMSETEALMGELRRFEDFNPDPSAMRAFGQLADPGDRLAFPPQLGTNGANLSAVLYDQCRTPIKRRALVDWLAELCAPEIADLDFIEVRELNEVLAVLIERDGTRVSVRSLSDGTLRFLGLLLAIRTAQPGSVLLVEDIDMGFHPTRLRVLAEFLEAATKDHKVQVIATTHAPVLLQWLSSETLDRAILCARSPDQEGTILRRLGELPHLAEVRARPGSDIGELFSTGWLELDL